MALTTSTITGRVPLPDDANPTAAEIVFTLSGYDTEGSQVIPGGAKARFVLDDGDMPAGAKLWRNTEGLRGTVYAVEVAWSEAGRRETLRRTASLGVVQVGDDASYTLGELLDATPVPVPDNTYWRSITQQDYDDMMQAKADAEAAAASVNLRGVADEAALTGLDPSQYGAAMVFDLDGASFLWDGSDLSAEITAGDPRYVAPDSDPTGASGAWAKAENGRVWYAGLHGVVPSGSDVSGTLQALIDKVAITGGGNIRLDLSTYSLSDGISVPENVRLVGLDCGQYPPPAYILDDDFLALARTRFVALAGFPAATPMVRIATEPGAKYCVDDAALLNVAVDCAGIAERGVDVISAKHCQVDGVIIFRPVVRGLYVGCLPEVDAPLETNADTQFNAFGMDKGIFVWCGNSGSADGIVLDGTTTANTNQNAWGLVKSVVNTGEGLRLENCDNETFLTVHTYSFGGTGVKFNGDANLALTARNNTIVRCETGGVNGRVLAETGSRYNRILALSTTNGAIAPVIQTDATIAYSLDTGSLEQWSSAVPRSALGTSAAWSNGGSNGALDFFARLVGATTGKTNTATIQSWLRGATSGQEDGELRFSVLNNGAMNTPLIVSGDQITVGVGGTAFKAFLTFPQAVDLPSINAGATHSFTITATGANPGDSVHLGVPTGFLGSGLVIDKFGITSANTVTIYVRNPTGSPIDLGSEFWRATVFDAA